MSLRPAPSTRLLWREVDGVEKRLHVACHSGARVLALATPQSLVPEARPRSCMRKRMRLRIMPASAAFRLLLPLQATRGLCSPLNPLSRALIFLFRGRVGQHVHLLPLSCSRTRSALTVNAHVVFGDMG
jgi:hypothetical protein